MSGLNKTDISNKNTGLIVGSGSASNDNVINTYETFKQKGIKGIDPFRILKTMSSTASANLASLFKIKGLSYSISATSSHCIGSAFEQIQQGKQTVMFAGGGDEVHWSSAVLFDAMRVLSATDNPKNASIPFAKNRGGFVFSSGAGIVVLENLEHAQQRGVNILAELVAYGASSDGCDIVKLNAEGVVLAM
ncbi:beta-ketoacyl synthase N-terminal-like domain-containing protein [Isorropodon fossajaponicum symbiont]|uniref:beta-ketoacyl synthase N-terminal-like domain-containing protein n=1 Tax=Isorropodon fossajaponicum symbiont TaxID=883811 RepID=UPI001FD952AE|nr:beta-ketoacyl synthase N-terminal-like domain-containing protein [Isorropodon fossajaponicum symbiont]